MKTLYKVPSTSLRLLGVLTIRRRRRASYLAHSLRYLVNKKIFKEGVLQ